METRVLKDRLIGFLDVLGFTAFLQRETLENVHKEYSSFIDAAKTRTFFKAQGDNSGRTNFEFAEFVSDSIVLVSNPIDDVYNVNNFVGAISYLLEMGFIANLPLRGAITRGDFLVDSVRNIFISKEYADLVHFEAAQEWSGCAVLGLAEDTIIDAIFGRVDKSILKEKQIGNNLVLSFKVPLKEKKSIELFVVNFLIFMTKEQILAGLNHLIEPKKKNNTNFFEFLNSLAFEYQSLPPQFLPAIRTMMVKTRSGVRVAFLDEDGNPCKPGVDEIHWEAYGRWRE